MKRFPNNRMEDKILLQQGNNLQIKFDITNKQERFISLISKQYLCSAVYFQLQAHSARCVDPNQSYPDYVTIISVRFTKLFKDDNLKYICKFSSEELDNANEKLTEANVWHQIYHHKEINKSGNGLFTFVVSFQSDIATSASGPFAAIYDDDDTDFKLCGTDGSVKFHKMILKVCSPVLQGMLDGEWKETSEGKITLADVSKVTCEHFKEYVYLDKLPNTDIEQLLVLGSYFMMPELVQKCLVKLLNKLDADNIVELTEFACNYKVTNLFVTLMNIIRKGLVNIDHLSEDNLIDMCHATNSTLNLKK
ncbi:BTB/POZ domain-containing protein [Phthorimaea operculella]|nr:BTB/POZ domain-containing protein [Phthorimaea operculella]